MTAGIYKLIFSNNKIYVGRSSNIELRFKAHLSDMKLGKASKKLLDAFNNFGEPRLEILQEENNLETQKKLEIEYIFKLKSLTNGLNSTFGGEDILYGELNARAKHTNEQIYFVLKLLAYSKESTLLDISKNTGVSLSVVRDISAGNRHLWLSVEYPLEYSIMIENKDNRLARSLANLTDIHRFKSKFEIYPKLISPNGEIIEITGSLSKFAKDNGLQIGNLSSVIHGRRKSHKGWTLAGDTL